MIFKRFLECGIFVRNDVIDGVLLGVWLLVFIRYLKYMFFGVKDFINIFVIDINREFDIFYLKFILIISYFNNLNISDEWVKVF